MFQLLSCFILTLAYCECSDVTANVFGALRDGLPAAFGDFNSDELTDIFVLRDEGKTMEIFLSAEEEPLLRTSKVPLRCNYTDKITSVVPGDFDGDAFMDVLVTTLHEGITNVHINWGGANHLNCSHPHRPVVKLKGQPLALDYNQNMIIDLFGLDPENEDARTFYIFNSSRGKPEKIKMNGSQTEIRMPHSHAFLDLNDDNMADLFLTTEKNFEIWLGHEHQFVFNDTIELPEKAVTIGQSFFIDLELRGRMDLVTPVCYDKDCNNSTLLVYCDRKWHNLQVNFKDPANSVWRFYDKGSKYTNLITLRSGDFNMDGYPDLLATLALQTDTQTFIMENVPCEVGCGNFTRTFVVRWDALSPFRKGTVMGAFFDFYQDGILDVILVQNNGTNDYKSAAFKNSLDYDANFIKVMVLTGLNNDKSNPMIMGRVGKKRRTYGTNLPGPKVAYGTTTQEGNRRHAESAQLPQSAHFSLNLPYNIFGLGRAPNFVENVTVGMSNNTRLWTQIIPNSQIVVIPWPPDQPLKWKAQLFVTPSKLILMSVAALMGVCGFIMIIIGVLHWKERQDDKRERKSESHRFHFDAM